jgi:hypothetical protein
MTMMMITIMAMKGDEAEGDEDEDEDKEGGCWWGLAMQAGWESICCRALLEALILEYYS